LPKGKIGIYLIFTFPQFYFTKCIFNFPIVHLHARIFLAILPFQIKFLKIIFELGKPLRNYLIHFVPEIGPRHLFRAPGSH
jgi:hypothetical protein